ncbi:MAG: hypothetical protein LBJ67_03540 [Planctomycetaceae bacterium]|jgi:TPR repeat protein|nr:hypothetical protein [Planctomycetaceae bacterium]
MKIKTHIIFLTLAVSITFVSFVHARTWTAKSGHKIEGDFVKFENGMVNIDLPNGKTADIELVQLCGDDQKFVKLQTEKNDDSPFVIIDASSKPEKETKNEIKIDDKNVNSGANNTAINQDTPLELLKSESDKNNPDAICWLALCYDNGLKGCYIDKSRAKELWQKAEKNADTGSSAAQFCRGICNQYGYGVSENPTEAIKWYRKAAEQGFAPACCNLGNCYYQGIGSDKNIVEAVEWFRQAAEKGDVSAQYNLAILYIKGEGIPENKSEAIKWLRKAAENGLTIAQRTLGVLLFGKDAAAEANIEAVKWFRKAADQNDDLAQFALGTCYLMGTGVEKNETEAEKWFRKAADNGNKKAEEILAILRQKENKNELGANIPPSPNSTDKDVTNQEKADLMKPTNESDPPAELTFIEFAGSYPAFSPDNTLIATVNMNGDGGAKTTTTVWDVTTGKRKFILKGEQLEFSPDGKYVVTGFQDWETQKYRNRQRRMKAQGKIPRDAVAESLIWLKVWDAKTGREVNELEVDGTQFAFFNNGKSIMVDGYLLSFPNGRRERKLKTDEIELALKAKKTRSDSSIGNSPTKFFSNDDKLFATGDPPKNTSQLYSNTTGKILHTFRGVTPRFSPDGKTITTEEYKYDDETSYLWDTETGKILYKFQGKEPVFSPNGQLIVTSEEDVTRLYNLNAQSFDLSFSLSSDESGTSTYNDQPEPQQHNQPQRQRRGRRVDVDDVGRAVEGGLRIYNIIKGFSR